MLVFSSLKEGGKKKLLFEANAKPRTTEDKDDVLREHPRQSMKP